MITRKIICFFALLMSIFICAQAQSEVASEYSHDAKASLQPDTHLTQDDQKKNNNGFMPGIDVSYKVGLLYYDAVKLSKLNRSDERMLILKEYGINKDSKNPYFLNAFTAGEGDKNNITLSWLTSLGNTDVTYFATGLSRFLADRAKAELNEMFFDKMKDELKKYPELAIIFPLTTQVLKTIKTYGYASIIQILRDAFENDLIVLPQNIYKLKDADYYCYLISDKDDEKQCKNRRNKLERFYKTETGKWLQLGLFTMNETFEGTNPANILKSVSNSEELKKLKCTLKKLSKKDEYNILSFIELSNVISQSLLSKEENRIWITPNEFNILLTDTTVLKYYLGLLLAQEQNKTTGKIYFSQDKDTISFAEILCDKNIENLKKLIKSSFAVYSRSNEAFKQIQAANENSKTVDPVSLYNYYRTFTNSIIPVAQNISNLTNNKIQLKQYEKVAKFLDTSVDLVSQIKSQQYTLAISSAVILLTNISTYEETKTDFKPIINAFTKYGALIANVATAQSSDEVKKAIEASALPVGSSAMKRNSNYGFMLNAYVGGYYGYSGKKDTLKALHSYGLYAPIGFSFYFGGNWSKKGWSTFTISANVLDLGALVNIYLKDGDNAILPNDFKVRLVDIISPGFQVSWMLGKTPASFFFGGNYIPQLYSYNNSYKSGWRWQIGLAIDIPMYRIYHHDK